MITYTVQHSGVSIDIVPVQAHVTDFANGDIVLDGFELAPGLLAVVGGGRGLVGGGGLIGGGVRGVLLLCVLDGIRDRVHDEQG